MDAKERPDSTQQLIAQAERLAKPAKTPGPESTQKIVAQSEKMLGRKPTGSSWGLGRWAIAVAIVAAAVVLARFLL